MNLTRFGPEHKLSLTPFLAPMIAGRTVILTG